MECDNAYNSNDDFDDREDTSASKDEENVRSSSSAIGSPHSVFTSPDFQELTTSASSSNKVLGHNYNGTVVFTNGPKNEAELQLYRVMQRASLLSYYDTLLEMGGDDVQQLCDAGEEEFLEIMALVGMASKPLHVRRFQKALQEWLTNPLMFQIPLSNASTSPRILPRPLSVHNVSSSPLSCSTSLTNLTPVSSPNNNAQSQQLGEISSCTSAVASSPVHGSISSLSSSPCPSSPVHTQNSQPILDEQQIKKLEKAATRLVESLPELEPKYPNTKKKIGKELQAVLNMSDDDPLRMQHIRKFSAIYGRFDCKRKPEKPLTLHEVSVNEAAAQICKHIPALLTRRDELFPLARRVVRDSGYQYSKGHSKSFAANNFTKSAPLMNTFRFHDNFNKRKNSMENITSGEGLIANEEKLNSLRTEIQKVTDRIEQLTNETQNISEEACEFSASKYQLEAFNRQKLQLLEEYRMLLNTNIPKKRGRKSKHFMVFNYERTSNDDNSLPDFNGDEIENSNDSQNYDDEDTKSSEITYIQDACSEKDEHGELESMHEEYDRIAENSNEVRRTEDLDGYEEKHYKERLIADEKFQVVACKGDNIIAVTNPALRLCMTSDIDSAMLKQERTSPVEFEQKL